MFLHFHCSNWRSGGVLLLFCYRKLRSTLEYQIIKSKRNEKSNSLRGNEREDYGLQSICDASWNLFIERGNGNCALGLPSLIGGTKPSPFLLKRTKKLWLSNLCSFHRDKSLERNPSRGNGSGLIRFSTTLLRIADGCLFTKAVQKIYRVPIQTF